MSKFDDAKKPGHIGYMIMLDENGIPIRRSADPDLFDTLNKSLPGIVNPSGGIDVFALSQKAQMKVGQSALEKKERGGGQQEKGFYDGCKKLDTDMDDLGSMLGSTQSSVDFLSRWMKSTHGRRSTDRADRPVKKKFDEPAEGTDHTHGMDFDGDTLTFGQMGWSPSPVPNLRDYIANLDVADTYPISLTSPYGEPGIKIDFTVTDLSSVIQPGIGHYRSERIDDGGVTSGKDFDVKSEPVVKKFDDDDDDDIVKKDKFED